MKMIILFSTVIWQYTFFQPCSNNSDQPVDKTANRVQEKFKPIKVNSSWGPWAKVSCYRGIQFRLSRGEFYNGQYMWHVQFRNLYNKEVKFGWNIVDPEKEAITRRDGNVLDVWRLGVGFDPDEEGNNRDAPHGGNWANSSSNVFVYITNVKFSNNVEWDTTFIDCDN